MYRAALIGCGRIGGGEVAGDAGIYSHAAAYDACTRTRLVAICDSDASRLAQCGEAWKVSSRYTDAAEMLERERPNIVSVSTPDASHYELISTVLKASGVRAILAEKPLALEVEHARKLLAMTAANGVLLAVNYRRRYAAGYIEARQLLVSGAIGTIQTVSGYYTKGLIHNGTHWFDLARFFAGDVATVSGVDLRRENGTDPTVDAFLQFKSGAAGSLHGCDDSAFTIFEMDLIGTAGRLRVVDFGHVFEMHGVTDSPYYRGYQTLAKTREFSGGMRDLLLHAVEDLVHCLDTGTQPKCSGADGLAALSIASAVRDSVSSGRPVTVQYN